MPGRRPRGGSRLLHSQRPCRLWGSAPPTSAAIHRPRRNAAVDKTGLEDCPICLEEPADVQMNPCKHTCCGSCLDQWMSQKSSFASTLRSGSSDTTCPMCRQATRPCAEETGQPLCTGLGGRTWGEPL